MSSIHNLKRFLSRLSRCFQQAFIQDGSITNTLPSIGSRTNPDISNNQLEIDLDENSIIEQQPLEQEIVNRLIRLMISPENQQSEPVLQNEQLINIYKYWKLYHRNDLPLINPTNYTPFEFQSIENNDISYIENPRLSVTKLLISGWCELRELYRIFAGSVRTPPTPAMEAGTKLHSKLEQEIHRMIDLLVIENFIKTNTAEIKQMYDLIDEDGIFDMDPVDYLANDWSESIIERLYSLILSSESREVVLHGYLNFEKELFVKNSEKIHDSSSILVSGIVDQIQFENPDDMDDYKLFNEIQRYVETEYNQVDETPLVDLSRFFSDINKITDNFPEFKLKFTDLKTRTAKLIPSQQSVLDSAKFQTFYYRYFFELLCKDEEFAYRCLIENAQRRGFDVDKPLNVLTTFRIFRKHYHLFYNDFMKLAEGKPIGFKPFDNERKYSDYEFGKLFVISDEFAQQKQLSGVSGHERFISRLNDYDTLSYDKLLLPLLKTWKTPPTIRYLATRSAQFYGIFANNLGDTTTVEYRYSFSGSILDTRVYDYDFDQLDKEIKHASQFWNGKIDAEPTDDVLKCKYCEFNSKCVIPKIGKISKSSNESIGPEIRKFLNDVKHLQKDC